MKLIIAVVQDRDWPTLRDMLIENNYRVTRLSSTGGFLRYGNTTLLLGVEDHEVAGALEIIGKTCLAREEPVPPLYEEHMVHTPAVVPVGGATVFVTQVERMVRL